ncbi:MAG: cupredoxin family copper-binding protein [Anaerolineae bacterium]|nr:cupredoxin family copper-binding protein [Gemmatimonadaceae bacterium]
MPSIAQSGATAPAERLTKTLFLRVTAITLALASASPADVVSQSLLDRPPNLSGGWVGNSGTLYFNFLHRFTESGEPEHKVSNVPTFLVAAGLPKRTLLGFNYATNSQLALRFPNEWEFFGRFAALLQDEGSPIDLAAQAGYNLAAEGADAEVSLGRRVGPARIMSAARVLSDPIESGKTRYAIAGGGTLRLGRFLALAGDVASLTSREAGERVAWSAGLHMAIPTTPHTLSLQAANTLTSTLQGSSRGGDDVRYGFEFTIPLTLRRYFGAGARPPSHGGEEVPAAPDTTRVATPDIDARTPAPGVPAPAPPDSLISDSMKVVTPDIDVRTRDTARTARAVRNASIRNFAFTPGRIEIAAGTTVQWKNNDPVAHTVTATDGSFNSGLIEYGKTYSRTFTERGTYNYYCIPHTFMKGVIVVR